MDAHSLIPVTPNPKVPRFVPGDTVKVSFRVREGERERVQAFQGLVIRKRRGGVGSTFTVRRVSQGIGIERTFPIYAPRLESVEILRSGIVRRAKLYYIRGLSTKDARLKERRLPPGESKKSRKKVAPETTQPANELVNEPANEPANESANESAS